MRRAFYEVSSVSGLLMSMMSTQAGGHKHRQIMVISEAILVGTEYLQ